jgi:hypothetical protein
VPSPWDGLTEPELDAVCDLVSTFRPPRHCVVVGDLRIQMAGPSPDAQPVERADLVGRLRRDLEHAKLDGLDPAKIYRVALEVQQRMTSNPLLPRPLPTFEDVAP